MSCSFCQRIERPLSQLLSDLSISPELVTTILDTTVGEPWIPVIQEFQQKLQSIKVRSRVKAARDLAELVEGLRIAVGVDPGQFGYELNLNLDSQGRYKDPGFLSSSHATHKNKHKHQHAHASKFRLPQIRTSLCFSPTSCQIRCTRTPEGLHWVCKVILRNRV